MPKDPRHPPEDLPEFPEIHEDGGDAYELPPELDAVPGRARRPSAGDLDRPDEDGPDDDVTPPRRPRGLQIGLVLAALAVAGGALLAYRAHHRATELAKGMAMAEALLRLDTAAGYRDAASLLEPLTEWDPLEAGSRRAFALAMLAADYRDEAAGAKAAALLVEPGRAEQVPAFANLAQAALFLGRGAVGDATTYASRARSQPQGKAWSGVLSARLSVIAGNLQGGFEPLEAATAADPGLAAAHALLGDLQRRGRGDPAAAHTAYLGALEASEKGSDQHGAQGASRPPRAVLGLAKLALSSQLPIGEALRPLQALIADTAGTPAAERGRASVLLAALQLRAGDRAAAASALDAADLDGPARSWAAKAAVALADSRSPYRAVLGAPPSLTSNVDDDPAELSPEPPPPPPAPKAKPATPAKKKAIAAVKRPATPAKKPATKKPAR